MGTANDLARTLGIPDDLEAAADVILAGHRRRIDLGTVNGKPFFNVASIGLSAELARELSARPEAALGAARLRARGAPGAGAGPALLGLDQRERRRRSRTRTHADRGRQRPLLRRRHGGRRATPRSTTAISTSTAWSSAPSGRLALMLRSFRSGEHGAWSEVRTAARHRVRDPHPPPAPGQRRRRADRRDAGGLQGATPARSPSSRRPRPPQRRASHLRRRGDSLHDRDASACAFVCMTL